MNAHLSLFFKNPHDIQRYDKTQKSLDSLLKIAKEQNETEIMTFVQKEKDFERGADCAQILAGYCAHML